MNTHTIQLNISLSFDELLQAVKNLPPSEKMLLSEMLSSESSEVGIDIPEEHRMLVKERIIKYENNPGSYLTWDEMERKITKK